MVILILLMGFLNISLSSASRKSSFRIFPVNYYWGLLSILVLLPNLMEAQVTPDPWRPFNEGQVIDLPAMSIYLGDMNHTVDFLSDENDEHTMTGLLATEVGWTNPASSTQIGLRSDSPGILFGGIAYPFNSATIMNWIPACGNLVAFDFPASAWWGPKARRSGRNTASDNTTEIFGQLFCFNRRR